VTPRSKYSESVTTSTSLGSFSAANLFNRRLQFHPVVRRVRVAANQFTFKFGRAQDAGPAARAGIADARTIGRETYLRHVDNLQAVRLLWQGRSCLRTSGFRWWIGWLQCRVTCRGSASASLPNWLRRSSMSPTKASDHPASDCADRPLPGRDFVSPATSSINHSRDNPRGKKRL
jgi:hypothetical protein